MFSLTPIRWRLPVKAGIGQIPYGLNPLPVKSATRLHGYWSEASTRLPVKTVTRKNDHDSRFGVLTVLKFGFRKVLGRAPR